MPFLKSLGKSVSKLFSGKKDHPALVLDLRGVVVAASIEDVYTVKRTLGEGMTAMVYEGVRLADGKAYALKAFKLNDGLEEACKGLRDEVEILRALPAHPPARLPDHPPAHPLANPPGCPGRTLPPAWPAAQRNATIDL